MIKWDTVIKSEESVLKKVLPVLKIPKHVFSHQVETKRVPKKTLSFSNQVANDIQIKKENVNKAEETDVIEIVNVKFHDVNPMNMSVRSDVVSDTRKIWFAKLIEEMYSGLCFKRVQTQITREHGH